MFDGSIGAAFYYYVIAAAILYGISYVVDVILGEFHIF